MSSLASLIIEHEVYYEDKLAGRIISHYASIDSYRGKMWRIVNKRFLPCPVSKVKWYRVHPILHKELRLLGEPVVRNKYGCWWGCLPTISNQELIEKVSKIYKEVQ